MIPCIPEWMRQKKDKKQGHILYFALFAAGVAGMMYLAGIRPYIVLSGSMEPVIHTGSLALVDTRDKIPKIGDIVTYCQQDMIVTHRIVREEGGGYVTKGDANETEDEGRVEQERILGICRCSIPLMGYAAWWIQHPLIKAAVFLLILSGVLLECIPNERDGKDFSKKEKEIIHYEKKKDC